MPLYTTICPCGTRMTIDITDGDVTGTCPGCGKAVDPHWSLLARETPPAAPATATDDILRLTKEALEGEQQ